MPGTAAGICVAGIASQPLFLAGRSEPNAAAAARNNDAASVVRSLWQDVYAQELVSAILLTDLLKKHWVGC